MRITKESKNKTTIASTTLPETNSKTNTSSQTPIEIALKIDENGMTTASNLYVFLELEPKNFSHWCLRNIKKNKLVDVSAATFAHKIEDFYQDAIQNKRTTEVNYD